MNNKCFKGIIFDLDGVIISTDEQHFLAWKALADKLQIPFTEEDNNRFRGVSRMECMDILSEIGGKEYSTQEKMIFAGWKNEIYRMLLENLDENSVSYEVKEVLSRLKEKKYLLAIGSSSKNAKFILEKIRLYEYFDAISDGTNIKRSKPDPEVFLLASKMLGLEPRECLVVEDASAGIESANAAGMKTASVGHAATEELGDYILDNIVSLLDFL